MAVQPDNSITIDLVIAASQPSHNDIAMIKCLIVNRYNIQQLFKVARDQTCDAMAYEYIKTIAQALINSGRSRNTFAYMCLDTDYKWSLDEILIALIETNEDTDRTIWLVAFLAKHLATPQA